MVKEIRGIIFDLDGTLYVYPPAHRAGLIASHKKYPVRTSYQKFVAKYDAARSANEARLYGTGSAHNRLLYFQRMLEIDECFSPQLALDLNRVYWTAFITSMQQQLEPQLREVMINLVRKYKIGVISNLTADVQFAKVAAHRLWPLIDAMVTSEEAGCEKPQTGGVELLLHKLNLRPENVVLVGDNPATDGLVATRMGITYIQIIRTDMKKTVTGVVTWKKIRKLAELPKLLEEL